MKVLQDFRKRAGWALLAVAALTILSGCASSSEDDLSARPWNEQRSWETGMPSGFYEGR